LGLSKKRFDSQFQIFKGWRKTEINLKASKTRRGLAAFPDSGSAEFGKFAGKDIFQFVGNIDGELLGCNSTS